MSDILESLFGPVPKSEAENVASQIVRMSNHLASLEDQHEKGNWADIFFHEHAMHDADALHWLETATNHGAHGGVVEPLQVCSLIFAKWLALLASRAHRFPIDFIEHYYEDTLGFAREKNESHDALARRTQARLESRKRILTRSDVRRVIEHDFGKINIKGEVLSVRVKDFNVVKNSGQSTLNVSLLAFRDANGMMGENVISIEQGKINKIQQDAIRDYKVWAKATCAKRDKEIGEIHKNKKTLDDVLKTYPAFIESTAARTVDFIYTVPHWILGKFSTENFSATKSELDNYKAKNLEDAKGKLAKLDIDFLIEVVKKKLHYAEMLRKEQVHREENLRKQVADAAKQFLGDIYTFQKSVRDCISPFLDFVVTIDGSITLNESDWYEKPLDTDADLRLEMVLKHADAMSDANWNISKEWPSTGLKLV